MKKIFDKLTALVLLTSAFLLAALIWTAVEDEAHAQVSRRNPTPSIWVDSTGTNSIGFNNDANLVLTKHGTNNTGLSFDVSLFGGSTNQFKLRVVNGIVTAITAY